MCPQVEQGQFRPLQKEERQSIWAQMWVGWSIFCSECHVVLYRYLLYLKKITQDIMGSECGREMVQEIRERKELQLVQRLGEWMDQGYMRLPYSNLNSSIFMTKSLKWNESSGCVFAFHLCSARVVEQAQSWTEHVLEFCLASTKEENRGKGVGFFVPCTYVSQESMDESNAVLTFMRIYNNSSKR